MSIKEDRDKYAPEMSSVYPPETEVAELQQKPYVLVCGNNSYGQAGIASGEDILMTPTSIEGKQ